MKKICIDRSSEKEIMLCVILNVRCNCAFDQEGDTLQTWWGDVLHSFVWDALFFTFYLQIGHQRADRQGKAA